MELSNLKSITINGVTINHIETSFNPNLKDEFKKSTLMTKTAIEEFANVKIQNDISFDEAHSKNLTFDSVEVKNNIAVPYNYIINNDVITFSDNTYGEVYIPSKLFIEDEIEKFNPNTINATKQVSKNYYF